MAAKLGQNQVLDPVLGRVLAMGFTHSWLGVMGETCGQICPSDFAVRQYHRHDLFHLHKGQGDRETNAAKMVTVFRIFVECLVFGGGLPRHS